MKFGDHVQVALIPNPHVGGQWMREKHENGRLIYRAVVTSRSRYKPTRSGEVWRGQIVNVFSPTAERPFILVFIRLLKKIRDPDLPPEVVIAPRKHRVRQEAREEFERARRFRF